MTNPANERPSDKRIAQMSITELGSEFIRADATGDKDTAYRIALAFNQNSKSYRDDLWPTSDKCYRDRDY